MRRMVIVAGGIVVAGIVAWAGVSVAHSIKCRRLENDYLDAVSSLTDSTQAYAVAGSIGVSNSQIEQDFHHLEKVQLQAIDGSLQSVYSECGSDAGRDTARKGSEILNQAENNILRL